MLERLKAWLRQRLLGHYELLREGGLFRFGPFVVAWDRLFRQAAAVVQARDAGNAISLPLLTMPPPIASQGRRGVVFLNNAYYNFLFLAAALRKRGWDAVAVSIEDPESPDAKYYHGEDINLFSADEDQFDRNLRGFFETVPARFGMVHFYGFGTMSFFPVFRDNRSAHMDKIPWDFMELRKRGVKIGYSICGCLDGAAQSTVKAWSGVCDHCVWQDRPDVCSDDRNLAWGHKVHMFCDLIATEGFPGLDWQGDGPKTFREPLTTALDEDLWRPDLEVPEKYRLTREPGELIVYHGVGNYLTRGVKGKEVKGSGAIIAAIDRLRAEGMKVRLEFVTDVPSKDVRFIQVQADILVDQLNHGRYGAQAREGLMLGKPTVCYLYPGEPEGQTHLESIETCPLISANEDGIYAVLKDLLSDAEKRRRVGAESRAFALKWHSATACAERFEEVYDRLMLSQPPDRNWRVQ